MSPVSLKLQEKNTFKTNWCYSLRDKTINDKLMCVPNYNDKDKIRLMFG